MELGNTWHECLLFTTINLFKYVWNAQNMKCRRLMGPKVFNLLDWIVETVNGSINILNNVCACSSRHHGHKPPYTWLTIISSNCGVKVYCSQMCALIQAFQLISIQLPNYTPEISQTTCHHSIPLNLLSVLTRFKSLKRMFTLVSAMSRKRRLTLKNELSSAPNVNGFEPWATSSKHSAVVNFKLVFTFIEFCGSRLFKTITHLAAFLDSIVFDWSK